MDWQTIVTSITGSSMITAGICYVLKKSFDRTLDIKFEQIKEQNKAVVLEEMRRRASLYDKQYETLKSSLSLVYRLRNVVRELLSSLKAGDTREVTSLSKKLDSFQVSLEQTLFADRAILAPFFFDSLHALRGEIVNARDLIHQMEKRRHEKQALIGDKLRPLEITYEHIDKIYLYLTTEIQAYLGVAEDGSRA